MTIARLISTSDWSVLPLGKSTQHLQEEFSPHKRVFPGILWVVHGYKRQYFTFNSLLHTERHINLKKSVSSSVGQERHGGSHESSAGGRYDSERCSKAIRVPRKTLDDRIKGRVQHGLWPGSSTVLTAKEESALAVYLLYMAEHGFPLLSNIAMGFAWDISLCSGTQGRFNLKTGPGKHMSYRTPSNVRHVYE